MQVCSSIFPGGSVHTTKFHKGFVQTSDYNSHSINIELPQEHATMHKFCTILITNESRVCTVHKNKNGTQQKFTQKCNEIQHLIKYNLPLLGHNCINTVPISGLETWDPCLQPNPGHKKCQWPYTDGVAKSIFHQDCWKHQCQVIPDGKKHPCNAIFSNYRTLIKHLREKHNIQANTISNQSLDWRLKKIANYETHINKVLSKSRHKYLLSLTSMENLNPDSDSKSSLESTPILGQVLRYKYTKDYTNDLIDYVTIIHNHQKKHNIIMEPDGPTPGNGDNNDNNTIDITVENDDNWNESNINVNTKSRSHRNNSSMTKETKHEGVCFGNVINDANIINLQPTCECGRLLFCDIVKNIYQKLKHNVYCQYCNKLQSKYSNIYHCSNKLYHSMFGSDYCQNCIEKKFNIKIVDDCNDNYNSNNMSEMIVSSPKTKQTKHECVVNNDNSNYNNTNNNCTSNVTTKSNSQCEPTLKSQCNMIEMAVDAPQKGSILNNILSNDNSNGIAGILTGVNVNKIELNISITQVQFSFYIWYTSLCKLQKL